MWLDVRVRNILLSVVIVISDILTLLLVVPALININSTLCMYLAIVLVAIGVYITYKAISRIWYYL